MAMVSQTQSMELTSANYGVLCHRQYADRIREALLPSCGNIWSKLVVTATTADDVKVTVDPAQPIETDPSTKSKCTIIATPPMKGRRKERSGYCLLVFQGSVISPVALPPMVRKQISWAGHLTRQANFNDTADVHSQEENGTNETANNNNFQSTLKSVTSEIWKELTNSSFDVEKDYLRIDVQPKMFNSDVRDELIHYKPLLACSASKVSYVVNVVIQSNSSSNEDDAQSSPTIQTVYWGISKSKEHFGDLNQRLNDYATSEVILESTCPKTGVDARSEGKNGAVKWNDPVSRAYYKLAQVFEDKQLIDMVASFHNNDGESLEASVSSILSHGAGLDIGASPGGWTQVLHNTLCLPTCVGVDPGILADRLMALKGVRHIRADISSEESIKGLAQHAPYSTIVCDASISHGTELLDKIAETLEGVSSLLEKSNDGQARNAITWPLCLVVTIKFPFKTNSSLVRHLEKVNNYIPGCLKRIALLGSSSSGDREGNVVDVEVRYKICHLFANSIAERTLIAVFHKK